MAEVTSPLLSVLIERIRESGPITLSEYMALALSHPEHGYYSKTPAIGARGDFITAPEISQMFGELVGAWALDIWMRHYPDHPLTLIECGPGRGTLMADILRTSKAVPNLQGSLSVHLVEINRALRREQEASLKPFECKSTWHNDLSELPEVPAIIIANEFLDALPIRQFQKSGKDWFEVMVTTDAGKLVPVLSLLPADPALIPATFHDANEGAILETSPAAQNAAFTLAHHVATHGGAALLIDYGHAKSAIGDTFQAMSAHGYSDPFSNPGEIDLTAHVDFEPVVKIANDAAARTFGPTEQGAFLNRLGLQQRAEVLRQKTGAETIDAAVHRLTSPDAMGDLFKVVAFTHPDVIVHGFSD